MNLGKVAGFEVIEKAFISAADVIPDVIPVIGFSDDLATLAGAVVSVAGTMKLLKIGKRSPNYKFLVQQLLS